MTRRIRENNAKYKTNYAMYNTMLKLLGENNAMYTA